MAPFIQGMAIGMAFGIVIYLACIALAVLIFVIRLVWWFATFFVPQLIAGLRELRPEFQQALAEGRARAARVEAWGRARREKDLAWMERHWATRWCARLNRRLLG
jgi:hypothetical protein